MILRDVSKGIDDAFMFCVIKSIRIARSLGHNKTLWTNSAIGLHLLGGIKGVVIIELLHGDTCPSQQLHELSTSYIKILIKSMVKSYIASFYQHVM